MNRFWKFTNNENPMMSDLSMINSLKFTNESEVMEVAYGGGIGGPKVHNFPIVRIQFPHPTFDYDIFSFDALTFVSEKMRHLLDIDPDFVSYFDVDDNECSPCFQAKRYKTMFNRATEFVIDTDKSFYTEIEVPEALQCLGPAIGRDYDNLAFKEDAKVRSHIFTDASESYLGELCTDEQAMKLLKAGCTGFRCWDTRQLKLFREPRKFRTLQGLAEEGPWDPVKQVELTRMVEWF